jgi:ATP-dependent Lhr-like helicase
MAAQRLVVQDLARPTPFAFPLMVELFREKLSNEAVADRIARMVAQLEKAAGGAAQGSSDEVRRALAFDRPVEDADAGAGEAGRGRSARRRAKGSGPASLRDN